MATGEIYRGPRIEWRPNMTDQEYSDYIDSLVLNGRGGDGLFAILLLLAAFATGVVVGALL